MPTNDDELLDPRVAAVLPALDAALAHHAAGRLDAAEALYEQVLRQVPSLSDALHLLGQLAYSRGQLDRAIALLGQAIDNLPEPAAEPHLNLGNAYAAAARLDDAAASFRQAIGIDPSLAVAYANLAQTLNLQNRFAEAVENARAALALDSRMFAAQVNLAFALRGLRRPAEAEAPLRQALALLPERLETLRDLANLLAELQRFPDSAALHRQAIALAPDNAASQFAFAATLIKMNDAAGASAHARRAVELAPNVTEHWIMLGTAERALGHFAEAGRCLDQALKIDPESVQARYQLNLAGRHKNAPDEEAKLRAALAKPDSSDADRIFAGFALGKILDSADRFDEAFAVIDAANSRYLHQQAAAGERFDAAVFSRQVDRIIAEATPDLFQSVAHWGTASELPVFVVGMPRSGTSLVEQIAASHSRVFGAGELPDLHAVVGQLTRSNAGRRRGDWDADQARALASQYMDRLRALGGDSARVVDKLPDNILALDHIAALFPGARIIHVRRDARDCCLSNLFQLFARGNLWAYRQTDCGQRMRDIDRLGRHWTAVLPMRLLEIDYETLVGDLEGESRRLIAFLGLDWEPRCLDFHLTERSVTTASTWQVRQKLYSGSVGRWRQYRRHLDPLFAALGVV